MDHDPIPATDAGPPATPDDHSGFRPFGHAVTRRARHAAEEVARSQHSAQAATAATTADATSTTLVAEADAPFDQDASPLVEAPLPPAAAVAPPPDPAVATGAAAPPPPPAPFIPPALPDSWRPPVRGEAPAPARPVIGPPPPRTRTQPEAPSWTPPGATPPAGDQGGRPRWVLPAAAAAVAVVVLAGLALVLLGGDDGEGARPQPGEVALTEEVDTDDLGPAPTTTEAPRTTTTTEAPTTTTEAPSTTGPPTTTVRPATPAPGPPVATPLPGLPAGSADGITEPELASALAAESDTARAECVTTSVFDQLDQATIDQIATATSLDDLDADTRQIWINTWIGCDKIIRGIP